MAPVLGITHYTRAAIAPINQLMGARFAERVEILNFLDEAILWLARRKGPLSPEVLERVEGLMVSAERAGASVIVSSGSSLTQAVGLASRRVGVPVVRMEKELAEEAVRRFRAVEVVVTAATNVRAFGQLLEEAGRAQGRQVSARFNVQEGAFDALLRNAPEVHDRIVLETISIATRQGVDAVLVPQVSAALVVERLAARQEVPVLSSLHVGVGRVAEIVQGSRGA